MTNSFSTNEVEQQKKAKASIYDNRLNTQPCVSLVSIKTAHLPPQGLCKLYVYDLSGSLL